MFDFGFNMISAFLHSPKDVLNSNSQSSLKITQIEKNNLTEIFKKIAEIYDNKKISKEMTFELTHLTGVKDNLERETNELNNQVIELVLNIDHATKEIHHLTEEVGGLSNELMVLQKDYEDLQPHYENLKNQTKILLKVVETINIEIKNIQNTISSLKGDKYSQWGIIGKMFSSFLQWKNFGKIEEQDRQLMDKINNLDDYEMVIKTKASVIDYVEKLGNEVKNKTEILRKNQEDIQNLNQKVSLDREEKVNKKKEVKEKGLEFKKKCLEIESKSQVIQKNILEIQEIEKKLNQTQFSSLNTENLQEAVYFEELLFALEKSMETKKEYKDLFDQYLLPLIQQTKDSLLKNSHHYLTLAAAEKGKAAHAGIEAIVNLVEKNAPPIASGGGSTQEVYLLPNEGVVFKKGNELSQEEENNVNSLMNIMSPGSVVGSYHIKKTSAEQFGVDKTSSQSQVMVQKRWMNSEPLEDVEAKPFIKEMILFSNINQSKKGSLLNQLSPDAEFNAILTGEVQFFDLHGDNLGLRPNIKPDQLKNYEKFKDLRFNTDFSDNITFAELLTAFINNQLKSDQEIEYKTNGIIKKYRLKDLPELQNALKIDSWELVLFDMDVSVGEDNIVQCRNDFRYSEHLIPLRSCLLATDWKDKPLSTETVQRLVNSEERDLNVKQWCRGETSSFYKRLSPQAKDSVKNYIAEQLKEPQYSLSYWRKNDKNNRSISNLRFDFSRNLGDITQHAELWKIIQDDLSSVKVRKKDTWESIAKRYHQDVDQLKKLNPEGLLAGKIKIKGADLTLDDVNGFSNRKKIATQLFPPLTLRQQTALFQRQNNRIKYLKGYQELSKMTQKDKIFDALKMFIEDPATPLTSLRREELVTEIESKKNSDRDLIQLKEMVCKECIPTYFNVLKSMYPLLADSFALDEELFGKEEAGERVGLETLESSINTAKSKHSNTSKALSAAIEMKLKNLNPTYTWIKIN